jgi:hypothetical protein
MNELIKPEDIIEEEVELEIAPDAFFATPHCRNCDLEMRAITATKLLWNGKLIATYEIYECPRCAKRLFNGSQAKEYEKILLLAKALEEGAPVYEQSVKLEGEGFLVRLPVKGILRKELKASITPLTVGDFLVRLHS